MDYIKINGKPIPYPNDFQMQREANIVSEITTMSGRKLADINGWKYADTTLSWGTLRENTLLTLLNETDPANGPFEFTFDEAESGKKTVTAYRVSRITTKTRFRDDYNNIVWSDVQLVLSFPDCYK